MKNPYKRWACGLLAGLLLLLVIHGGIVYAVDPACYYRMPGQWQPVFFSERFQMAGLAKNTEADTVMLGTSMVANYRVSQLEETYGESAVKLTIPDGYLSEFGQVLDTVFRYHQPKRVIFGLDANVLIRDESGLTDAMPGYLYNGNPLDDVQYLLNKDALYYSGYTLAANHWGAAGSVEEAFTWDADQWWNHMTALKNYERPEPVADNLTSDAYLANTEKNLAVIGAWAMAHPDTQFQIFFPPYSILYWDKMERLGEQEAVLTALERACEVLTGYENVELHGALFANEIVENLDYYCDYIHHSGQTAEQVLTLIRDGTYQITPENRQQTLANWQAFVVHYDYEKFWDASFWIQWNAQHAK